MSEEKAPWWKRFGTWLAAGLAAVALFVVAMAKRQKSAGPPSVAPLPPPPVLTTITIPAVNTQPTMQYNDTKVVPNGTPSKAQVAKILLGLREKDEKKDN